jgi:hypothetical protein
MSLVGHDLPIMGHAPIHQVGEQLTNAMSAWETSQQHLLVRTKLNACVNPSHLMQKR